jgi:DNA-binding NarL/FixJ family response regulator
MTIRVLVVDDQMLVRAGFSAIISAASDLDVVGEASDGSEAVALATEHKPDVVLMDIRMPVMDGIAATALVTALEPAPAVLVLTTFDLDEYVYDALRAGASGFLLKDTPPLELLHAIRVVAAGDALLAPAITKRLIHDFAQRRASPAHRPETVKFLTERETEVLIEIARGLSNQQIAEKLYVGEATIKTHIGRILAKLNLASRAQAVTYAYESGLVVPGT